MSKCDTCALPGYCCRSIRLFGQRVTPLGFEVTFSDELDPAKALKAISVHDLPFVPVARRETYQPADPPGWEGAPISPTRSTWTYSCPRLGEDGRCTDYDNRPWLCRQFAPEDDALCLHYQGAEGSADDLHLEVLRRTGTRPAYKATLDEMAAREAAKGES